MINDDDLNKDTIKAGQLNNGHLMHNFVDDEGIKRQAFYSCVEVQKVPNEIIS